MNERAPDTAPGTDWITGVLGLTFTALGLWAAVAPATFARTVANFGPLNEHLIRDFAAASLAFGIGLMAAARIAAWRTPILMLAAIWNGLHGISHLIEVDHAHPHVLGAVEAVLLALVTLALLRQLRRSTRT
ncbi:hypothetical protein SMC26_19245 [Actinomadura fulvescens]|uniref:DUF4345 domain-containing protein n=1 Tax=Actinomadura fulvescens TaxID=46160 RepID=A0ABN3QGQ3_9ACTN